MNGRSRRVGGYAGVLQLVVFATLVVVAGRFFEGYNHLRQAISELGGVEATVPWIQNANFVVTGLLVLAFARGLHRALEGDGAGAAGRGPLLIGVFGLLTATTVPALPCDPGCQPVTVAGTLHNLSAIAGFALAITGILLIGRRVRALPGWNGHAGLSRLLGLLALGALVGMLASPALGLEGAFGLIQRILVGAVLGWIAITGWRIARTTPKRSAEEGTPPRA